LSQPSTLTAKEFLLRIVECGEAERIGEEIRLSGVATIGRDPTCSVVLRDSSVSRRHARVELSPEGLKLVDLGSGNGVWVGERRVDYLVLKAGQRFRIGPATFECVLPVSEGPALEDLDKTVVGATPRLAPAAPSPAVGGPGFLVRVFSGTDPGNATLEIAVKGGSATLGRDDSCTVAIDDPDISRRHARIEFKGQGFEVVDLGSRNGTWIDGRRVDGPVPFRPGDRIRLGRNAAIECRLLPAGAGPSAATPPVDFEKTIVIPSTAEMLARTRRIEEEGEPVEVSAHQPFLLDDEEMVWFVVSGGIDIFTVALEKGKPAGTRSHFLAILPGQCFFGFDSRRYGMGSGFLAVGKQGTRLRKIRASRFRELGSGPAGAPAIAALVDTWVAGLSKSLVRDTQAPAPTEASLKPGGGVILGKQKKASSAEGVVWIEIWSGSVLFDDMATPSFAGKRVFFPVTPDSWVQPVSEEFGELSVTPLRTGEAVGQAALWEGLSVFQQVICECEFINKKLAAVDEFIRLEHKARHLEAAKEAAYDAIGSVLRTEAASPREFLETGGTEPVLRACELVGKRQGIEVKSHPGLDELTYEEKINAIASASGFRTRVVALRGDWWNRDHGPLLGQLEKTKAPVAILPAGPKSYDCVDPKSGKRTRVTPDVAASLSAFAHSFYRPFPDGSLNAREIMKFGARGLAADFKLVALMGILVGVLGVLTPYLTGRIFDSAIPQADRGVLLGFGLALFGAALATSLFKLTQGIATVRVQGKMEYAIQAALWDRLLNLPTHFFRKYPAGDLAERASGIDAIQSLVSGAGVGAVLGSLSGIFYVALMFFYNLHLALAAIGLTVVFVGTTTLSNYLQLRYQRVEIQMRGRISGLVLNLITGVGKLRIAGAEHHAFRVWAEQFAGQRRVTFATGRIQAAVAVFSGVFPILSSMAIFMVMLYEQKLTAESGIPPPTTGEFIAFNAAFALFLTSMQALSDASLNLLRAVPIYERLSPIVTTEAEVDATKVFPGRLTGEIEISHVHFRYDEDGPWVLKDLTLKIKPGEFVAFVGSSGCGKSTLMRLLLGFEQPNMGTIYYDGQNLASLDLRMLRQQLGVVLQVSRVLPTDIYRNIVGVSSRSIEEAWKAAEMAGLADDVRRMPMGMHTYVSEGGGTLSGGQRQRLLIARAVVNRPKIIFLDEATSALDNRTQNVVTESLESLDATRIVIAHRLSTVIHADRICYLEGGKIAETGTYQELMDLNGLFAQLARRQMA
jgi:NHLM bacteriocin system ABC transporter ATP-binding protein